MDKKKTLILGLILFISVFSVWQLSAQNVRKVEFIERHYDYREGSDTISLYFNLLDNLGRKANLNNITSESLADGLKIKENGEYIPSGRSWFEVLSSGERIPKDYTFSVLVDLTIPADGKEEIFKAVDSLVRSAPDSCVYLSFFGQNVSRSMMVTRNDIESKKPYFQEVASDKVFFSAVYSKLSEFSRQEWGKDGDIVVEEGYVKNPEIARRAAMNRDKNILFIFTDGDTRAGAYDGVAMYDVIEFQRNEDYRVPSVYAFYYTEKNGQVLIENTLKAICQPRYDENSSKAGQLMEDRQGAFMPSRNIQDVLSHFKQIVNDMKYDYRFSYTAAPESEYQGNMTYSSTWYNNPLEGSAIFSIGSPERPWPVREENAAGLFVRILVALIVALLCFAVFFLVSRWLIPTVQSKIFEKKYYKRYVPEERVQRRVCHYCRQEISEGQLVVTKCRHIMHVHCWQENGYRCSEYGQNCKEGIQAHVEEGSLFTKSSIRECYQTIEGICAGFIAWVIYEIAGRGFFPTLSSSLAGMAFNNEDTISMMLDDCSGKISAFLTIGILLGTLLSAVFRYNDEYRKKDAKIYCKIALLSLFTGLVGMLAFALGGVIMTLIVSGAGLTHIPWYCSLPGYIIFSLSISLSLTVKSSIPVKSALLGGLCSAVIGFIVLYCTSGMRGWVTMLLDFIIYGGGLGASLVTVRLLAEKYFLVIKNGARAGLQIPIHKWMNSTGGGNKVKIGMTGECEIQMNWEKSNKVEKEHAELFIDTTSLPVIKPLAPLVIYNTRAELPVGKTCVLSNGDTFKIGDTTFQYVEKD